MSTKRFFNFAFSNSTPFQKSIYASNPTQRVLAAGYDSIIKGMINVTVEIAILKVNFIAYKVIKKDSFVNDKLNRNLNA